MSSSTGGGVPSRSSSAIMVSTVRGYHLLKIDGYSRTKKVLRFGEFTRSCSFRVGIHSWHIRYYPNGSSYTVREYADGSRDADSVSLFVVLESDEYVTGVQETAEVRLSLLDHAGEPVPEYVRTETAALSSSSNSRIFLSCNLIESEVLEASEHLANDRFTVRCDIALMKAPSAVADPPAAMVDVAVPLPELNRDMEALLQSEEGADVTFEVGGESFAAHRCVLAARSSVFRAELFGAMKESTGGKARVDGVEARAFKALLHFIYTDTVQEFDGKEEISMAQHLLVAADRYNLERLKLICEDKLCKRIDVSSAATTLALAEQHHCPSLKKACMDFLYSPGNLKAVEATDGFEHLARSCPVILRELIAKLVAL
uniref:BTB domain-containing protein n=1 Tax=Oryza punctata TaxID=4537 RepID=A0A0E0M7U4_ORYPU